MPQRVSLEPSDVRVAWRLALTLFVVGAALRWFAPFGGGGPADGFLRSDVPGLNGLLLGAAPFVGLMRAYRRPLRTPVEPYGATTRPVIGGWRGLAPISAAVLSLVSSSAWCSGEPLHGPLITVLLLAAFGGALESQRRLRWAHDPLAWTDPALDALRVQPSTLVFAAPVAVGAAVAAASSDSPSERAWWSFTLFLLVWISAWQAYAGLTASVLARPDWRRAVVASYWAGGMVLGLSTDPSRHPEMLAYYAAVPAIVVWLERERRRLVAGRVAELLSIGQQDRLAARYGPQLEPLGVVELVTGRQWRASAPLRSRAASRPR